MSDPAATAHRQQAQQLGLIASIVTLPFRFFGVMVGALALSILLECACMTLFWPEQSWRHARDMLGFEAAQLSANFTRSALVQEPGRTAHALLDHAYEWIFIKTGLSSTIEDASRRSRDGLSQTTRDFRYYLSVVYDHLEHYLIAAAYTVLVFALRLLVLVLSLPLFVLAAFVGLVDGLVRRDLRRFSAGRESGFIYHRARASLMPLAVLPWVTYLALPVSVHPLLVLLPCASLLGLAVNIAAGSFKKYL
ncbi:TPA: TIGR03747 family integrating conjugative element membrane protein [Pseudomonas aeruginosa]|uniref:TIGR03747 family integrating conjugative element membrane protein n=1 Tax=Pseudomonas aeruginosa TaxID=287 RepID=UPI00070DAF8C|nr:TIGR03747 family integrating conjugative element membrane protein [Pseudomonas aeruginosa]RUE28698.1 TIGR03747 family integrating conjugative element membrane protein [Pseudomonas aeruginosa]HBO0987396.1 TIGR03747 family integrating conjugative element membrane protein [Pseudomonas aeruginosa]HCI1801394.1 TIGR03747 family integrating conjugative element membrane protein [Pseudomonas aeruginosa]HCI2598815.1 TIGR03747 family integrating conjugative element membrane protein [Pseudomonas aerugin